MVGPQLPKLLQTGTQIAGSASENGDFEQKRGIRVIPAGETRKSIFVKLYDDELAVRHLQSLAMLLCVNPVTVLLNFSRVQDGMLSCFFSGSRLARKKDHECAADTEGALHANFAAMKFYDSFRDREPETETVVR